MTKFKLKKKVKLYLIGIILCIILILIGLKLYKNYKYHQTYEYKFLQINYNLEEIKILTTKLNNDYLDNLLTKEYNGNIPKLLQEKYFMLKNLNRYLDYIDKNPNKNLNEVVAMVNVNRDKPFYENLEITDTSKGNALLVNKYHALDKDYEVSDIVNVSSTYAYAGMKLNKEAYEAFKRLANDAKKEGFTIVILSSYRTHEYQDKLWNDRKNKSGIEKADAYAARAGSSEHETGLAIDVADYNNPVNFEEQEAYQWMLNNSYKYGYILRYAEGKEDITGYDYEAWHYRYLGIDLATKVYNEGITFDEYYEFYLNK